MPLVRTWIEWSRGRKEQPQIAGLLRDGRLTTEEDPFSGEFVGEGVGEEGRKVFVKYDMDGRKLRNAKTCKRKTTFTCSHHSFSLQPLPQSHPFLTLFCHKANLLILAIMAQSHSMAHSAIDDVLKNFSKPSALGFLRVMILCTVAAAAVASRLFSVIRMSSVSVELEYQLSDLVSQDSRVSFMNVRCRN